MKTTALLLLTAAWSLHSIGMAAMHATAPPDAYRPSACERVARAASMGELPLKEAVLLQARLRFAPARVMTGSQYAPRAGECVEGDPCGTAFYKDVQRVYHELSAQERAELRSYSPDLQVIMDARRHKTPPGLTALPDFPLELQLTTDNVIVHYSLTNVTHKAPDTYYALLVLHYMEMAIKGKMTRTHFRKAYVEGASNGVGRLHVYICSIDANGAWVDVSVIAGDKMAGYIKISNKIKAHYSANLWKLKLKGLCHHEYFHGIQSTYNAWSSLWFLEATAVWAQYYYAKDYVSFPGYFGAPESVINTPNEPIWLNTYRKYSTCALAYYLSDKYMSYKFMQAYFFNSETQSDALEVLKTTIAAQGSTFARDYVKFWAAMATQRVPSLTKYMPVVPPTLTINTYGTKDVTGEVYLTGAVIHKFDPQAGAPGTILITDMKPSGNIKSGLAYGPRPYLQESVDGKAWVERFGKRYKEAFYIITDPVYSGTDMVARVYNYGVILPYIEITRVQAQSPIYAGETADMTTTYDLLGTYPNEPFNVQIKVTEKAQGVVDQVTGVQPLAPGQGKTVTMRFYSIVTEWGLYRFAYLLSVPEDAWKTPQCATLGKTSVMVLKPPTSRRGHAAGGTPRLALRRE